MAIHEPHLESANPIYYASKGLCLWYLATFHDLRLHNLHYLTDDPCLVTANHISYYDPPVLGALSDHPFFFLARKTLFKPPIMDWLLPRVRSLPVDQENPDMAGLKRIIDVARRGGQVVLFPEGSRSFDGNLQPPMPGIGLVVAKTNLPVLPVRIFGAHLAWPRGKKPQLFKPVEAVLGPPFTPHSTLTDKRARYEDIARQVMDHIAAIQPVTLSE